MNKINILFIISLINFSFACSISSGFSVSVQPTYLAFSPIGDVAYQVSSAENKIYVFNYDYKTAKLTKQHHYETGGVNPRGAAISADGKYVYVVNRASNSISIFKVTNTTTGTLKKVDTVIEQYPLNRIGFSPKGDYAYVLSPAANLIIEYSIDKNGRLSKIKTIPTGVSPQKLGFSPSGKYAYVLNSSTNDIYKYSFNEKTGDLTLLQSDTFQTNTTGLNLFSFSSDGKHIYLPSTDQNLIRHYAIDDNENIINKDYKDITENLMMPLIVNNFKEFSYITNNGSNEIVMFYPQNDGSYSVGSGSQYRLKTLMEPEMSFPEYRNPENHVFVTSSDENCIATYQIQDDGKLLPLNINS